MVLVLAAASMIFASQARAETNGGLELVQDHSKVCMVTNSFMGVPQIPVSAGGKTYYGCCQGCVGKVANDPSVRYAIDPVSGARVDKATAVIAKDGSGKLFYFASEKTFKRFAAQAGASN